MTRGRRKDMTIPPSRALLQQRDYRARKARYLADLEDRCQRLEQENSHLRDQVDSLAAQLRTGAAPPPPPQANPEVVAATHELMHSLSSTAASLARYQQLAFGPAGPSAPHPSAHRSPMALATPSFTPSPVPFPSRKLPSPRPDPRLDAGPFAITSAVHPSDPHYYASAAVYPPRALPRRSPPSAGHSQYDSEYGGYSDERGLTEEADEMDGMDEEDASPAAEGSVLHRTSDVRSTASSDEGLARPARAP